MTTGDENAAHEATTPKASETIVRPVEPVAAGEWGYRDTAERDNAIAEGRRMCIALMKERDAARSEMEQRCREKLDQFEAYGITVDSALATRAECDEAQASAAMWEREARRLGLEMGAEIERLKAAIKRQKGALKVFKAANKRVAMARVPAEINEAAEAARRNEAGVQEANAVLTDEVERLTERNAGLAAALREAKKLGTHRIAAGDDYACDVADIADEALEKFTGEKP